MLPVVSGLRGPDKGGLSSETLLADLTWSVNDEHHRRSVVVRLPPPPDSWPVFPSYDLGRQAVAMEAVRRGSAVPIPEVLWFEPDPEPLGAPFIVMARVDGVAAPDYMPYTWGSWLTDMTADEQSQVADACIDLLADDPRRRAVGGDDHRARAPRLRGFVLAPTRRQRARAVRVGARGSCLSDDRARIRGAGRAVARVRAVIPASVGATRDSGTSCGPASNRSRCSTGRWLRSRRPRSTSAGCCSSRSTSSARQSARAGRGSPASSPGTLPSSATNVQRAPRSPAARLVPALCRPPPGDRVDSHHGPRRALRRDARARRNPRGSSWTCAFLVELIDARRRLLNRDPTCSSHPDSEDPWNT